MTRAGAITVVFAGAAVRVEYAPGRPEEIARFLFQDAPDDGALVPDASFRIHEEAAHGVLCLECDGARFYTGASAGAAAAALLDAVVYRLAACSRGGLVMHAAAVARSGRAMLLPGQTGTGKTTLTAWLLAQGFRYQSDELAFIATGSSIVQGLARPLNVKRAAAGALQPYLEVERHAEAVLSTPSAVLVPVRLLSAEDPAGPLPLGDIVFPRYAPGADFALTRLSPAQAGLRLMGCLINARNLDGHGFADVARIARERPAYDLSYGAFDQLGTWIG